MKKTIFFSSLEIDEEIENWSKKYYQMVLWRRKTQFCQKCLRKVVRNQKSLRSKSEQVKKKSCSSEKFVLFSEKFSAHSEGRSDGRAERFQTLSDTIFCPKTKNYVRTVTFFSGESNSHQMIACTRKLHFWQLRRNICAKGVEFLIQNLGIDEKIKIIRIGNQNSALAT